MTTIRSVGACAVLALLSVALPAQDKPIKATKSLAKRWVKDFVGRDEKRREKARSMMQRATAETRPLLFEALAARRFPKPKRRSKPGQTTVEVQLEESPLKKGTFILHVPKRRKRGPVPVLFRLHGSGDDAENYASRWGGMGFADEWIAITPTIPSADRLGWHQPGAQELLLKALRHVVERHDVDHDRIYISGYSAGGGAATMLAQTWPHLVAAYYSRGRTHDKYHPNPEGSKRCASAIPGFCVVGLEDKPDRVQGYRDLEAFAKKEKCDVVFHFVPGKGHTYIESLDAEGFPFLLKHERKPDPKRFHALFYRYNNRTSKYAERQHWLRAIDYRTGNEGTPCTVSVDGNTITIDAPHLTKGEVWVNDTIVDLDKPVVLVVDGEKEFEGVVERDVGFLLDGYLRDLDPGRLYWNRIAFERKRRR